MQPIVPNLWFDDNAEEAAKFYVSLLEDSKITNVVPYGPNTPGPEGSTMLVEFELQGRSYCGINGGPQFPFTEAVSWQISSTDLGEMLLDPDQEKVDRVTQAFLKVDGEPFDIAALPAAFEGTA